MSEESEERISPDGLHAMFVKSASGWDIADQWNFQYYDAELAIDLGRFKAGTIVDTIVLILVDTEKVAAQIYQLNGQKDGKCELTDAYEFRLEFSVSVGDCVKLPAVKLPAVKSEPKETSDR